MNCLTDIGSFIFDGVNSNTYNLIVCWIDEEADHNTGLTRELKLGEANMVRNVPSQYGAVYSEFLEFSFYIMHKDFTNFDLQESRSINNWLTKSSTPKLLHFNNSETEYVNYYVTITAIEDIIIEGHCAKKITANSNSPYAFSNPKKKTYTVNDTKTIKIKNESDCGIYYPKITIVKDTTTTSVTIKNVTDNNNEVIIDVTNHPSLIIDSEKMQVYDLNNILVPVSELGWNDEYMTSYNSNQIYMPRFVDGINEIIITGSCSITFECVYPRKVGKVYCD